MVLPELYKVKTTEGAKLIQIETLIAKVKASTGGKVLAVKVPANPGRSYQFMVKLKDIKDKKEGQISNKGA